jgi:hypothetical protein
VATSLRGSPLGTTAGGGEVGGGVGNGTGDGVAEGETGAGVGGDWAQACNVNPKPKGAPRQTLTSHRDKDLVSKDLKQRDK